VTTYVDTSAFLALVDLDAREHHTAGRIWTELLDNDDRLITCNYVIVETCALLHKRCGVSALRAFLEDILPAVLVEWVDVPLHNAGISGLLMSSRKGPNIVDCVSFAAMRKLAVTDAFTFDRHFSDQGFRMLSAE
jgi:predicted nucleic acid-binding protein